MAKTTANNKMLYNVIMGNAQRSTTGRMNAVIPVEMIDADVLYQRIEGRNHNKILRLKSEWDYNLMDALIVVAHPETHNFFVVDGLGRLTVARELGIEQIDCVIIVGPEDPVERRKFEASYFLRQAVCTDPLRPVLMHNARVIVGDPIAIAIENVCNEFSVEIMQKQGNRSEKKLGSYDRTYKVVKVNGESGLRFVFNAINSAGFDNEPNGYSGRLVSVLGKFYNAYPDISASELGEYLRDMSPITFQSRAIAKYPERCHNPEIPMILYLQDWATEHKNKEKAFDENGKKLEIA